MTDKLQQISALLHEASAYSTISHEPGPGVTGLG